MNTTRQVIISVDDFGISERANTHMLALIEERKISRVSIMMHGILRPYEVEKLLASGVKLDIHLDRKHIIHENRKLADGLLFRSIEFIWSYFFGSNRPSRVHHVWHDQLQEFQEVFGRSPDGLNTHEHVHYFPPYFNALLKLAEEYRIPFIRLGMQNSKNYNLIAWVINILGSLNRSALRRSHVVTTDRVISWDWTGHRGNFQSFIDSLESGTSTEIIFHPERSEEYDYMQGDMFQYDTF